MHLLADGDLRFQMVEESNEFPAAVAFLTSADDFAVEDIESGEQSCRAMAFVIVRLTLRQARSQREDRRGAIQSLNLALLVHAQYQRAFGRVQVQAHNVPHLFLKVRIV